MANPVMKRIDQSLQARTPAGYPTMPGYQVGGQGAGQPGAAYGGGQPAAGAGQPGAAYGGGQPYAQQVPPSSTRPGTSPDMSEFEQQYLDPSADAVDRGVMTLDDVLVKTASLFGLLLVGGAASWMLTIVNPALAMGASAVSAILAFILVIAISMKKAISVPLIVGYAALEGVFLGAISATFEFQYPGIVAQAVIGTVSVFAVTLVLFKSGKVRATPKLRRILLVGLLGILVYRVIALILSMAGIVPSTGLTLAVGVIAVVLGAISLISDFDIAQRAIASRTPRVFAWYVAFGLMVTLVWIYLEILRILSILRHN